MGSSTLAMRKYTRDLRQKVLDHLGRKCAKCSFSDERALQVDHINGGGNKQRKKISWREMYKQVLNSVPGEKYQILCANCNWIKRAENMEHIKKTRVHGIIQTQKRLMQDELNERAVKRKKFWKKLFEELKQKPPGEELKVEVVEDVNKENLRRRIYRVASRRGVYVKTRIEGNELFVSITRFSPWISPLKEL